MAKIWLLTKSNILKAKGQAATFFIIIILAATLMNVGLVTGFNYSRNFDEKAKSSNAADIMLAVQGGSDDAAQKITRQMKEDPAVKEVNTRPILLAPSQYLYNDGEQGRGAAFLNKEDAGNLGQITYTQKSQRTYEHPIYLPYLYKPGGGYELGDTFEISLTVNGNKEEFEFQVAGFYEETFLATINSTVTGYLLEEADFQRLSEETDGCICGTLYWLKVSDNQEVEKTLSKYAGLFKDPSAEATRLETSYYEEVRTARTITSSVGAILVIAFSVIVVFISLIVIRFRISNSIEEDVKTIGALKAIGYVNRQIIGSILIQYMLITCIGSALGIGLSYAVLPKIGDLFAAQTGVTWQQGFDAGIAGGVLAILVLLVTMVSYLAARRAGKLHPIIALRSGFTTHSFRRNHCPLSRGGGTLSTKLAGKLFLRSWKQNILIGLIIAAISFAAVFAGSMYYNIGVENEGFVRLVGGEVSDLQVAVSSEAGAKRLLAKMRGHKDVEKVFYYNTVQVAISGDYEVWSYIAEDFGQLDYQNLLYEGRFPAYDNEIAMNGTLAKDRGKAIGDTITVYRSGEKEEYLITGFTQGSNYLGRDICMTEAGYHKLVSDYWSPYTAVYLNDGADLDGIINELERDPDVQEVVNIRSVIDSSTGVYQDVIGLFAEVIIVVTAAIVALVLYLVIVTQLLRQRQELGIKKALGFTTRQLIIQNALAFLPTIVGGVVLGSVAAYYQLNNCLSLLFIGIGIMKVFFEIPSGLLQALMAGIIIFGFGVAVLVSLRIRKVTPYELMSGE